MPRADSRQEQQLFLGQLILGFRRVAICVDGGRQLVRWRRVNDCPVD